MVDCHESKKRYRFDQVRGRWVEYRDKKIFVATMAEAEEELDERIDRNEELEDN
jgi:glycyl-tRNA synthetase